MLLRILTIPLSEAREHEVYENSIHEIISWADGEPLIRCCCISARTNQGCKYQLSPERNHFTYITIPEDFTFPDLSVRDRSEAIRYFLK